MTKVNYKAIQFVAALITLVVLFASLYFEYVSGLHPCPLCLMQRACVFLLMIVMGMSLRTQSKAHLVSFLHIIFAGAGLFFASRQLWLQSLPAANAPACMPGLDVLIRYFPWQTVARALFWGSGDCGDNSWQMLGISMAGWSALYFLFMLFTGLFLYANTSKLSMSVE